MSKLDELPKALRVWPVISLPYRFYCTCRIARCYSYWLHSEDEESIKRFYWNDKMHEVRMLIEANEKYMGGMKNWGFKEDFFTEPLKTGIAYLGKTKINEEEMLAIGREWFEGSLYRQILNGEPGVLAEVNGNTVERFYVGLEDAICPDMCWRGIRWLYARMLAWSGYRTYDIIPWTED